jgi:hypothetical protein
LVSIRCQSRQYVLGRDGRGATQLRSQHLQRPLPSSSRGDFTTGKKRSMLWCV